MIFLSPTLASMHVSLSSSMLLLLILCSLISSASSKTLPSFTSESVVIITGAAGFVGSELAMALHRTYAPKMIVCIDSMQHMMVQDRNDHESHLALFDLKRQRVFHTMQTLGSNGIFYRADFRPTIPEYFDVGEVPMLDYIFRDHNPTHVVHLADAYHRGAPEETIQAVPRLKQDIKGGMIESLMEQLRKQARDTGTMAHFVYASSYEVYNYLQTTPGTSNPFSEDMPLSTPSSLRGTTKMLDELLAQQYYNRYGVNSIGLRFFPIYGPWGLPGTPLYEMAERAVTRKNILAGVSGNADEVRDFVYVDDAVDAIMSAMQVATSAPTVVNVGSGMGTTFREIAEQMERLMAAEHSLPLRKQPETSSAIASTVRAKELLGFEAQVPLIQQGLVQLLSWHFDRAFPYGGHASKQQNLQGIASCNPYDKECLQGAPVFPCVSECSHETQCTTSFFDDVTAFTALLTESCETVLYTIDIDKDLVALPSAQADAKSQSYIKKNPHCNIAFVSEQSPLVRKLKQRNNFSLFSTAVEEFRRILDATGAKKVLSHGFWTLVPLPIPSFFVGDEHILQLLPKLSPGAFFGEQAKRAIYTAPHVLITNIDSLLEEATLQPFHSQSPGATALLVGRRDLLDSTNSRKKPTINESVQAAAYRMVRIGIIDEMMGTGSGVQFMDSSWMVHSLQNEDARLFRCDILGEVVQWDVEKDQDALDFVVGLHDMWATVLERGKGNDPWWIGDGAVTVAEGVVGARRRLMEDGEGAAAALPITDEPPEDTIAQKANDDQQAPDVKVAEGEAEGEAAVRDLPAELGENQGEAVAIAEGNEPDNSKDVEPDNGGDQLKESPRTAEDIEGLKNQQGASKGEGVAIKQDGPTQDEEQAARTSTEDKGEGIPAKAINVELEEEGIPAKAFNVELEEDKDPEPDAAKNEEESLEILEGLDLKNPDEEDLEEDETTGEDRASKRVVDPAVDKNAVEATLSHKAPSSRADISSYDTWMGVLSSGNTRYFVRIVPSAEVGIEFLDPSASERAQA